MCLQFKESSTGHYNIFQKSVSSAFLVHIVSTAFKSLQMNSISYFFSYFCLFLLVLLHMVYYFSFTFLYNTIPKVLWLWKRIKVKILLDRLNFYIPKAKMGDSRMSREQPQTLEVSILVVRFFFIFYIQIPCKQHRQTLHEHSDT